MGSLAWTGEGAENCCGSDAPEGAEDFGLCSKTERVESFCQRNTPEGLMLFENAAVSFLKKIRSLNPHAKIVWAYGMLGDMLSVQIKDAVDRFRRENDDPDVWYLSLPAATEETMGSRDHPGPACHEAAARTTADFLRKILK